MSGLKNCPFCGSADLIYSRNYNCIRCNDCQSLGPAGDSCNPAEEIWNQRTTLSDDKPPTNGAARAAAPDAWQLPDLSEAELSVLRAQHYPRIIDNKGRLV